MIDQGLTPPTPDPIVPEAVVGIGHAVVATGELGELKAPGRTLFLPYLGGERTPLNSASIRGAVTA